MNNLAEICAETCAETTNAMPSIADWLMVAITFVYALVTVFIWIANYKSTKLTKEQLEESKQQFEETKRLGVMPYLQFENHKNSCDCEIDLVLSDNDTDGGRYLLGLKFKNIGLGTAKDITYKWTNFTGSYDRGSFPIKSLQSTEEQTVRINIRLPKTKYENTTSEMVFSYKDLLEHQYTQIVKLDLIYSTDNKTSSIKHTTLPPKIIE